MAFSANRAADDRPLSPRELQVLELTSIGLTNAQIAERLAVSTHAIKFHLASIYRKLGVTNRTEAAVRLVHEAATHTASASADVDAGHGPPTA